jgi:hypothetical protein
MFISMLCLISMSGAVADAKESAADVLSNVVASEQLYKNRETIYDFQYEFHYMKREEPGVIKTWVGQRRFVAQGTRRYYSSTDRIPAKEGGTKYIGLVYMFDGKTSRINLQDQVVNVQDGSKLSSGVWTHPHTLILETQGLFSSSLSQYLSEAFRPKTDERVEAWRGRMEGHETIAGLDCVRLRFDLLDPNLRDPLRMTRILWLAVDRNYLPVRNEVYRDDSFGKFHATTISTIDEWKEIAPGIWAPLSATEQTWDAPALFEDKKEIVANTIKHRLVKSDLNPHYDDSFFQQMDIPNGIPVHELNANGDIVRTTVQGGLPARPTPKRSWLYPLLSVLAMFVAIPGGLFAWRARRKTLARSLTSQ